jgi:DNA-binding response OmpR family regulator
MAKILIVEDNPGLQESLFGLLEVEHHLVELVDNGLDAKERLLFYKFDLIILDWMVPGMNGLEVLRDFRQRGGKTPVLMLTGKDHIDEKSASFESGVDDYLTKPFSPKELVLRVKALLRRPAEIVSFGETIQVGNLRLEPAKLTVDFGGTSIRLAPSEFKLLEFLMRYPDVFFTPNTLIERVWPSEAEVTATSIRTCVRAIRKKLDRSADQSLIENVPGVGYRFKSSAAGK